VIIRRPYQGRYSAQFEEEDCVMDNFRQDIHNRQSIGRGEIVDL